MTTGDMIIQHLLASQMTSQCTLNINRGLFCLFLELDLSLNRLFLSPLTLDGGGSCVLVLSIWSKPLGLTSREIDQNKSLHLNNQRYIHVHLITPNTHVDVYIHTMYKYASPHACCMYAVQMNVYSFIHTPLRAVSLL